MEKFQFVAFVFNAICAVLNLLLHSAGPYFACSTVANMRSIDDCASNASHVFTGFNWTPNCFDHSSATAFFISASFFCVAIKALHSPQSTPQKPIKLVGELFSILSLFFIPNLFCAD
jgi:hypothetical protein